jgi:molybdenum-dependent DNA-binding transcriptional regulator ModE
MVVEKRLTLTDAAEKMGVSYRQAKRLHKSFENDGISGLLHGNHGRVQISALIRWWTSILATYLRDCW